MRRILAGSALCLACAHATSSPKIAARDAPGASGTTTAAPVSPRPIAAATAFEGSVDLGNVRLHLRCEGTGEPLVVFEAGLGLDSSAWGLVEPEVARHSRACVYDRAGRGRSGPAPYPHGQRRMADELYALLQQAAQPGPYLLVGHSMGGANVRWFLDAHPREVVGMVLVDAATEDWPSKVLAGIPAEARSGFWRNLRAWEGLDEESYVAGYEGLRSSSASLGSGPLVILTAGKPENDFQSRFEMQSALARLSSNALHGVVQNSSHNIPLENPSSVVSAILAAVRAARTHAQLAPGQLIDVR